MSDETRDRDAIRHILAVYNINGDRGRVAALGEVFAADGVIAFSGEATYGRDAIVARLSKSATRHPALTVSRHHITTSLIDINGDNAAGRTYFQVLTDIGLDHHGHYVDRFVRTVDGWRIVHRDVRIDYQSPDSLYSRLHVRGQAPD
ncbi:MAG: nuclear transport factor 2 family protein [Rhizorhabdus sp.]